MFDGSSEKKLLRSPLICMFQACEHLMLNTFRPMSETMCRLLQRTSLKPVSTTTTAIADGCECVVHPTSKMLTRHKARTSKAKKQPKRNIKNRCAANELFRNQFCSSIFTFQSNTRHLQTQAARVQKPLIEL